MNVPVAVQDDLTGQTVKGYHLLERIGKGGFGAVYRASQPAVGREVAMKVILPSFASHPDFIRRFENEAQVVARLEHPFIVPLFDYWRDPDGAYLVMRWLRGGSLTNAIARARWSPEWAAVLLDQIASALTVAHRRGVIHRDIKPDNILLDEDRNAYLSDFGIAKDVRIRNPDPDSGGFSGSPGYTAPEQIKDRPITPQSDIYSLGIVMYEVLAGKHPFQKSGSSLVDVLYIQLSENIPLLHPQFDHIPPEVDEVLQRATAKDPLDRFPDPVAFSQAFRNALRLGMLATGDTLHEEFEAVSTEMIRSTSTIVLSDPQNPYKGLRPFEQVDAGDFFGREALVERLVVRLSENDPAKRFLTVIGPSGSGKSSLVRAGLIPALRNGALPDSENWFYVEIIPGTDPLHELEAALLSVAVDPVENLIAQIMEDQQGLVQAVERVLPQDERSRLFLLIDQFEEIFTLSEDEPRRQRLLNALFYAATAPKSRLNLVITLRADYYDRPLAYPQFGDLLRRRTEVVLPLTRDELARAITSPSERAGMVLEDGLVSAILRDVGDQPAALPLVQYAMTELYERRHNRRMTLRAYEDIGGVLGALARRADELYEGLDSDTKEAARQMFLRLVTLGEGSEDTRRRVARDELLSVALDGGAQAISTVIDTFGKYRLLTFDHEPATRTPTVEVAHEALIRQWERLRTWLDEGREDLRMHRRLTLATEDYANSGRDRSFLARGTRLDQFAAWTLTTKMALNAEETEFLRASIAERETRRAEEAARNARERSLEEQSRARLRMTVFTLIVLLVVASLLSIFALSQAQAAQNSAAQAQTAESRALREADRAATAQSNAEIQAQLARVEAANAERSAAEAGSLALAASAQLALQDGQTDLAAALALEANRLSEAPLQSQLALAEAAYYPGTVRRIPVDLAINALALSRDERLILVGTRSAALALFDAGTGELLRTLGDTQTAHTDRIVGVAFSRDGRYALSASWDDSARLWDLATGALVQTYTGHTDNVLAAAFSPDDQQILTGSSDGTARLWDTDNGTPLLTFTGHTSSVNAVAFNPDGRRIATASSDNSVRLWNAAVTGGEGTLLDTLIGHTDRVNSIAFNPNGSLLASASDDRTVRLWSVRTGDTAQIFGGTNDDDGHTDRVTSVVFSSTQPHLYSTSWDGTLIVWDTVSGEALHQFYGHTDQVVGVAVGEVGRYAVTGANDQTLRVWILPGLDQLVMLTGYLNVSNAVVFSADGRYVYSVGESLLRWEPDTLAGGVRRYGSSGGELASIALSPDGEYALVGRADRGLQLWDLAAGGIVRFFQGHTGRVSAVAFTPDGTQAISASYDASLILWEISTGSIVRRFVGGHEDRILTAAISPDGLTVISGSNDGSIVLWDLATGAQIRRILGITTSVRQLVFLPDGESVIGALGDGTLRRWALSDGSEIQRFVGHRGTVTTAALWGDLLISGASDNTLILWDIATAAIIHRFTTPGGANSLAFSPDGLRAVSGAGDAALRLWQTLSLNSLPEWFVANRYVPEWTCEQRERFRVEPLCP